ncbi:hypothetical protein [Sideroxydans sp. CL21]|jgi:hypothetical protein|uniref:hypothetical protein n=1 Tax=Sideroxydans sp. CL21 TaxID=2600596 RepID=UPI0024BC080F|nr:hypothetical protein [Sideroxydans sp. CL21]
MGGWGCPHEVEGKCQKVLNKPCDIGMKGCVLAGRFRFADPSKNRPKKAPPNQAPEKPSAGDDQQ